MKQNAQAPSTRAKDCQALTTNNGVEYAKKNDKRWLINTGNNNIMRLLFNV